MQKMKLVFLPLVVMTLAGCNSGLLVSPTSQVQLSGTLRPFPSQTFTPEHPPTATPTQTATPTPTSTPIYYTVGENDDMFGIALRHGISLEALKTANPSINPYFMGAGTQLLLPITPTSAQATPTASAATPTPTSSGTQMVSLQTDCYRDGAGSVTCFVLAHNNSQKPLENITAKVTLTGIANEYTQTQVAILPLNLLPAGAALPLIAYFNAPTPENSLQQLKSISGCLSQKMIHVTSRSTLITYRPK